MLLAATPSLAPTRLVLLDGRFQPELSGEVAGGSTLSEGTPNLELRDGDDPVLALAGALAAGGFSLETQRDLGRVEIVHISRPGVSTASHVSLDFLPGARGFVFERAPGAEPARSAIASRHSRSLRAPKSSSRRARRRRRSRSRQPERLARTGRRVPQLCARDGAQADAPADFCQARGARAENLARRSVPAGRDAQGRYDD